MNSGMYIIVYLVYMFCWWRIFEKMRFSLVDLILPGRNVYCLFEGLTGSGIVGLAIVFAQYILLKNPELSTYGMILAGLTNIFLSYQLAAVFGKSFFFALGLMFPPTHPIFLLILGFGKSEYKN